LTYKTFLIQYKTKKIKRKTKEEVKDVVSLGNILERTNHRKESYSAQGGRKMWIWEKG
jgi:hypothetical protein